ncbi:hypothetical protein BN1723_017390, partial [Verticillium longisporum]
MIVSISFALMVDRVGRRPIFLLATGGMFGTLCVWTLTCGLYEQHRAPGANIAMIVFIWVFSFFYATAWSGLLIGYAVEILPYSLRAKGLMILNIAIQVALCLNNQANPVAMDHWKGEEGTGYGGNTWILYLIYVIWVFFELCFVFYMFYHANGNDQHPTVQFEFREIRDTIRLEQAANTSTKYIDFFKTKGNRYRLIVIIALGIFSQ